MYIFHINSNVSHYSINNESLEFLLVNILKGVLHQQPTDLKGGLDICTPNMAIYASICLDHAGEKK